VTAHNEPRLDRPPYAPGGASRAARGTVQALIGGMLGLIIVLLLLVLLRGPVAPPAMIVNDDPTCQAPPRVLSPQELATVRWWDEC
jgi:hypothetical protein